MYNIVDFVIIGVILFSVIVSLFRGFVSEFISLVTWIIAFIVAARFYEHLAIYFTQIESVSIRYAVSMIILFIITLILGSVINYIMSVLVNKTGLSGTDRILGAGFGFLRGILVVAAILFFVDTFTSFSTTEMWKSSQLIPHFGFIIEWFFNQIKANSSFINFK